MVTELIVSPPLVNLRLTVPVFPSIAEVEPGTELSSFEHAGAMAAQPVKTASANA
jgi:hypothetical protein